MTAAITTAAALLVHALLLLVAARKIRAWRQSVRRTRDACAAAAKSTLEAARAAAVHATAARESLAEAMKCTRLVVLAAYRTEELVGDPRRCGPDPAAHPPAAPAPDGGPPPAGSTPPTRVTTAGTFLTLYDPQA